MNVLVIRYVRHNDGFLLARLAPESLDVVNINIGDGRIKYLTHVGRDAIQLARDGARVLRAGRM
jgi:hypothetical protein